MGWFLHDSILRHERVSPNIQNICEQVTKVLNLLASLWKSTPSSSNQTHPLFVFPHLTQIIYPYHIASKLVEYDNLKAKSFEDICVYSNE